MSKLLVRDDYCLVLGECIPAYDWLSPWQVAQIIVNGWFHNRVIVGTDRYQLDLAHEADTRTIDKPLRDTLSEWGE